MKAFILLLFIGFNVERTFSQIEPSAAGKDTGYTKIINDRAQKIVAKIIATDSKKAKQVSLIVANQYRLLNEIHTSRNEQIRALKAQADLNKEALANAIGKLEDDANLQLAVLHKKFLSTLARKLSPAQIDQVKDGMTYDVVHVTYNGYNKMILNLTDEQKKQIMDWLIEAREHAMDAESSDKKHAWFGKYKGRINNYLSAAGYNLNKEGKEWEKRRNEVKSTTFPQ